MIHICPEESKREVLQYLKYRFGLIPGLFNQNNFYSASNGRIFVGPKNLIVKHHIETIGVLIARIQKSVKPSSDLFQLYGTHVTKSIVDLNSEQVTRYCNGFDIDRLELPTDEIIPGFVMVRYDTIPIGCGLLRETLLENQIPKECRLRLNLC